jgi:hypothetical protein
MKNRITASRAEPSETPRLLDMVTPSCQQYAERPSDLLDEAGWGAGSRAEQH